MKINEIFKSFQGEGPSAGQLANFVRFYGCPLSCNFCDSAFTWDTNKYSIKEELRHMELFEILPLLNVKDYNLTVITGGEPLLYQDDLYELISYINRSVVPYGSHRFEIETSGFMLLEPRFFDYVYSKNEPNSIANIRFNVSPKLSSSGNRRKTVNDKFFEDMFILLDNCSDSVIYKFVVTDLSDLLEIRDFCVKYVIDSSRVWLMPEGASIKELAEKTPFVAKNALLNGYNFTSRLHILVWDKKRGV